ncbi:MAG: dTDP-rhamnosyl transferase rfbF [Meiothermus sp.]
MLAPNGQRSARQISVWCYLEESMGETIWAVIPTFNRRELLRECIRAVLGQTRPPDVVWVRDNASQDGTAEMVRQEFPRVRLVRGKNNLGSSGGFAEGLRAGYEGGADWIWLVDNDAVPQPDALEKLLEAQRRLENSGYRVGALGSIALWTDGKPHPMNHTPPDWKRLHLRHRLAQLGCQPQRWSSFVSVLVPSRVVERYGLPYYSFFTWNDDLEYFGRIARGELVVFVRDSVVVHKTKTPYIAALSIGERYFYEVRNRIWVLRGDAFHWLEKVWLFLNILGQIPVYLWRNRLPGWKVVLRGIEEGLHTLPSETVAVGARIEAEPIVLARR